jgi:hypothetical protein
MQRYGYLRKLLSGYDKFNIIVSSIEIPEFKFATDEGAVIHNSPRNVLFMPMPEGRAIGTLIGLLHRVNAKARVALITANNYDPSVPTFSIGGPSVNSFSGETLKSEFTQFQIEYPAARRARFAGLAFETVRNEDNDLIRDYGFLFLTRTSKGAPCFVLCGVLAFGTMMAVESLGSLPRTSEAARLIRRGQKLFVAVEGSVKGLDEGSTTLSVCRAL